MSCRFLIAAVLLALSTVLNPARAAPIVYDFRVIVTTGPLSGQTLNGSFSFDDSLLNGPDLVDLNGLNLLSFNLTFAGQTFDTTNADAWGLYFDSGKLTNFRIGGFVSGLNVIFDLANAPDFFIEFDKFTGYDPTSGAVSTGAVVWPVPEPSSGLLLVAGMIAASLRRRRRIA